MVLDPASGKNVTVKGWGWGPKTLLLVVCLDTGVLGLVHSKVNSRTFQNG